MRLSFFRVFVAHVIVTWRRRLRIANSRCFRSHFVLILVTCSDDPTLDFGYVLFISRAVYESVSTIFSCSNPRPPLCRETSRTSTSTRFAFSRQDNPPKHSTMASRRPLRFPLATKETSDWREAKKARPSTFWSWVCAGCMTTEMFHLAVRAEQIYVLTLRRSMGPRTASTSTSLANFRAASAAWPRVPATSYTSSLCQQPWPKCSLKCGIFNWCTSLCPAIQQDQGGNGRHLLSFERAERWAIVAFWPFVPTCHFQRTSL